MDWVDTVVNVVRWIYYLRIPLLTAAVLALLPLILTKGPAKSLGANIVRELSRIEVAVVGVFCALTAMPIVVAANAVLETGPTRFRLDDPGASAVDAGGIWLGLAKLVSMVLSADFTGKPWSAAVVVALAVAAASVCALCIGAMGEDGPLRGLPFAALGLVVGALLNAGILRFFAAVSSGPSQPVDRSAEGLGAGFFAAGEGLHDAHTVAAILFAATAIVFGLISFIKGRALARPAVPVGSVSPRIPTFANVLSLLAIACWLLGGAAFFFDYFPFPGPTMLIGLFLLAGLVFKIDHYYRMDDAPQGLEIPTAKSILMRGREPGRDHRVVLIGAAGGGIQAAAWTAQALAGIESWLLDHKGPETAQQWRRSIRLVSGVSGGSVGLYHYLDKWPESEADAEPQRRKEALEEAARAAGSSSLDAVGWGLSGPDLLRVLGAFRPVGPLRFLDRGWALDQAIGSWSDRADRPLTDWLPDANDLDSRPAVVFNSTLAESGRQMLFSTTCFDPKGGFSFLSGGSSRDRRAKFTLPAATAARLSATFPYVTPAARGRGAGDGERNDASPVELAQHCVDGVYYDNYGVRSIAHWLEDSFTIHEESLDQPKLDVLILELIGLPDKAPGRPGRRGWPFQLIVPLTTLYGVALGSQDSRNDDYMRQFEGQWEAKTAGLEIFYRPLTFKPQDDDAIPLNWRLIEDDKQDIADAWDACKDEWGEKIAAYLEGGAEALRRLESENGR